jgi:hypothetical protein
MRIAFFGDVHGCVLHALGAAVMLGSRRAVRLDALVQVGDLGAFPTPERMDEPSRRFGAGNPAQSDFFRLLDPPPRVADGVRLALGRVPPFLFVSGNHEDHEWLAALHREDGRGPVPVDPLGLYRHVECGSVVEVAGQRTAFLGLIEATDGSMDLDPAAYERLMGTEPGSVDILVTHDGPYAMSEYRGQVQGSAKLTALIERLRPRLHVGGHYHHENGPRRYGPTVSYALSQLVGPKTAKDGSPVNPRQQVAPGSVGLLDTETYAFEYIHDDWLADVHGDDLDLAALVASAG